MAHCPLRQKLGIQRLGSSSQLCSPPTCRALSSQEMVGMVEMWVPAGWCHLFVESMVRVVLAGQPLRGASLPSAHMHHPYKEDALCARCKRKIIGHCYNFGFLLFLPSVAAILKFLCTFSALSLPLLAEVETEAGGSVPRGPTKPHVPPVYRGGN